MNVMHQKVCHAVRTVLGGEDFNSAILQDGTHGCKKERFFYSRDS
jgi:hypothetical protein